MNLLVVTPILPPDIGGPATYVPEIIARLDEKTVTVITFTNRPLPVPKTTIHSISQKGNSLLRQSRLVMSLLKFGQRADLIYAQDPEVTGLASVIVGRLLGKPVALKYVGDPTWEQNFGSGKTKKFLEDYLQHPDTGLASHIQIALTKLSFQLATKIITPSKFLRDVINQKYHIDVKKISVIFNAIDLATESGRKFSRKKTYKIITVGRLVNWKRIDGIIRAVKTLNQTSNAVLELTIVGDGPERNKLEALADRHIIFAGKLSKEKTKTEIKNSDVLVLNSVYEGLPHTILEAFAASTPVIATNIAGTNELAINRKTAITVETDNDEQLAHAIEEVIDSPELAESLTQAALTLIKDSYSWDRATEQLKNVLKNLTKI